MTNPHLDPILINGVIIRQRAEVPTINRYYMAVHYPTSDTRSCISLKPDGFRLSAGKLLSSVEGGRIGSVRRPPGALSLNAGVGTMSWAYGSWDLFPIYVGFTS